MTDSVSRGGLLFRCLDRLFILRPAVMVPLWVFFVSGATGALRASGHAGPMLLPPRTVAIGLAAMSAILGGGYLLNQIVDVEGDRANDKLFFLPRELISAGSARAELAVVWLIAAAIALALPVAFQAVAVAALVLNVTYSSRPIRAKARFPLDLIWNGLGFGLVATFSGWATVSPPGLRCLQLGFAYTLAVAGVTASTTIPDLKGDSATGLRTTAVVLGRHRTSCIAVLLMALAALTGLVIRDPVASVGSLLSLPMLIRAHVTGSSRDRLAASQVSVGVFCLLVSIRAPFLLALVALVVLGSRLYYRRRFGMTYPELGAERALRSVR
mgnify:CR=1 FL=1